ncbi:hypothetical protein D4764_06G0007760, partial [Takifugu flavidus]
MRPHYLPREFTHALAVVVYIPPSVNADAACDVLLSAVSRLQTQHPDAFLLISGDFNHASPSSSLPKFTQYVTCHTKDNKTLDLFYANTKEASLSLFLFLPLAVPTTTFNAHGEDIENLTKCITDYIDFCVENTVPTRTVRSFSNSKPWITRDMKALLKEKKRAFVSGDKEELKTVQRELRRKIRQEKNNYRRKMENQLQQNNICGVWKGLKTISGFKEQKSQPVGDRGSITDRDRKRMDRLVRRASSVLGCPLDSVEVVGNGRMMAKLSSMLNNTSHPLQDTLTALGSSFSERLLHPCCVKE